MGIDLLRSPLCSREAVGDPWHLPASHHCVSTTQGWKRRSQMPTNVGEDHVHQAVMKAGQLVNPVKAMRRGKFWPPTSRKPRLSINTRDSNPSLDPKTNPNPNPGLFLNLGPGTR